MVEENILSAEAFRCINKIALQDKDHAGSFLSPLSVPNSPVETSFTLKIDRGSAAFNGILRLFMLRKIVYYSAMLKKKKPPIFIV